MNNFNPDLPVQTRDGRKARIICKDKKGKYPIVALIGEGIYAYLPNGKYYGTLDNCLDLFNIPSDDDKRAEIAKEIGSSPRERVAIVVALEHINWPACADRP